MDARRGDGGGESGVLEVLAGFADAEGGVRAAAGGVVALAAKGRGGLRGSIARLERLGAGSGGGLVPSGDVLVGGAGVVNDFFVRHGVKDDTVVDHGGCPAVRKGNGADRWEKDC